MSQIRDYYDALARDYDRNRFENSYGRYVDAQERGILRHWLDGIAPEKIVDIGCGTGRLLDFAMTGVDTSGEMLKVAAEKFAGRHLIQSSLPNLEALDGVYRGAICFHVFMHLHEDLVAQSLQAIARKVVQGGFLVFDIPSRYRRALGRRRASDTGWHGDTAASRQDIERLMGANWRIVRRRGVLFFPIHLVPAFMRPGLRWLDTCIGRTPLGCYASYHVYQLERT